MQKQPENSKPFKDFQLKLKEFREALDVLEEHLRKEDIKYLPPTPKDVPSQGYTPSVDSKVTLDV